MEPLFTRLATKHRFIDIDKVRIKTYPLWALFVFCSSELTQKQTCAILFFAGYFGFIRGKRVVFPYFSCMRSYPQYGILQAATLTRIMTLIVSHP